MESDKPQDVTVGAAVPEQTVFNPLPWVWVGLCALLAFRGLVAGSTLAIVPFAASGAMAFPPLWKFARSRNVIWPLWTRFVIAPIWLIPGIILWAAAALSTGETKPNISSAPAEKAAMSSSDALEPCEQATRGQLNHPSTADFDILDTTIRNIGDETTFSIGLTAKNSFGLEVKMISTCVFNDWNLSLVHVAEAR